jgi:hypothetical protein
LFLVCRVTWAADAAEIFLLAFALPGISPASSVSPGHRRCAGHLDARRDAGWRVVLGTVADRIGGRTPGPGANRPDEPVDWWRVSPAAERERHKGGVGGTAMINSMDRDEVQRLVRDERAQLVEVLPKPEYDWAHLPEAVHLPLKELTADLPPCWTRAGRWSSTATTPNVT